MAELFIYFYTLICVHVSSFLLDTANNSHAACGISDRLHLSHHRIVGGHEAVLGSLPWMVMLTELGDHVCGGSIIGDRLIMTAAHCFEHPENMIVGRWKAVTGKHRIDRLESQQQEFSVEKIIKHPSYDSNTVANDIAILVLRDRIMYNDYMRPVCLPTGENYHIGQYCITAGWGDTQGTSDYDVLNQVEVPIIPDSICLRRDWYGSEFIPATTFCAGYPNGGKDSCGGDSGGAFVCQFSRRWVQMGVTSWGILCGAPRWPGIYTDVTMYIQWIRDQALLIGLPLAS